MQLGTAGTEPGREETVMVRKRAELCGGRRRWLKATICTLLVAGTVPAMTQPAAAAVGPNLVVDASADNRPIDPRIYGINMGFPLGPDQGEALSQALDLGLHRVGGDGATEYNWQLQSYNQAANWYWETFHETPFETPTARIDRAEANGRDLMLTLPVLGWVPNAPGHDVNPAINNCTFPLDHSAEYARQTGHDPEGDAANNPNCGSGWTCPVGTTFEAVTDDGFEFNEFEHPGLYGFGDGRCRHADTTTTKPERIEGNDPTLAAVCPGGQPDPVNEPYTCNAPAAFDGAWVSSLVAAKGPGATTGAAMYELDNEPDLWWATHHEIHPGCVDWDTLTEHSVDVAAAAKDADATAQVAGPAMSTIIDMIGPRWEQDWDPGRCNPSNELTDPSDERLAHGGDRSFVEWYVDRMEQASQGGPRLLDVLDVHHYPQEPGVVDSAAGDATVQAARLNSVRALWDPTAIDTTWLGGPDGVYPNTALRVIPRLKQWAARFPGTKTGITEYSFGGFDTVNGTLAQADALGVFAREGLDVAALWPTEDLNLTTELANAFAIYRNYDGLHHKFGDTFVRSYSGGPNQSGQGQLSVYSAKRSDGALTTVVINKAAQPLTSNLTVGGFQAAPQAQVFEYTGGSIVQKPSESVGVTGSVSRTYPANSITLLVMPAASLPRTTLTADAIILHYPVIGAPGSINTAKATLRSDTTGAPIPGQTITFTAGTALLCTATTDANGVAFCPSYPIPAIVQILLNLGYTASYAGTPAWAPATAKGNLIRLGPLTL